MDIVLDMDGVMVDFVDGALEGYRILRPWRKQPKRKDVVDYGFSSVMSRDEIELVMSLPNFFAGLKPIRGAICTIKKLISDGHHIKIVTVPPTWITREGGNELMINNTANDKIVWLYNNIFSVTSLSLSDVTFCFNNKTHIRGDIIFEDNFANVVNFSGHKVMMETLYNNAHVGLRNDVKFVKSWKEFYSFVKEVDSCQTTKIPLCC